MSDRHVTTSDCFDEGAIIELFNWNSPDHEHTRLSLRRELERAMDEAFQVCEADERGGSDG